MDAQGIQDIANYRQELRLPEYKWIPGETGTVAVTEINGRKFYGHNTTLERSYLGTDNRALREAALKDLQDAGELTGYKYGNWNVRFLTHAETEALIKAENELGSLEGEEITLHVDRPSCDNCLENLPKLVKIYGIEELRIVDSTGKVVTFSKEK